MPTRFRAYEKIGDLSVAVAAPAIHEIEIPLCPLDSPAKPGHDSRVCCERRNFFTPSFAGTTLLSSALLVQL
jgi:hypothetical protein